MCYGLYSTQVNYLCNCSSNCQIDCCRMGNICIPVFGTHAQKYRERPENSHCGFILNERTVRCGAFHTQNNCLQRCASKIVAEVRFLFSGQFKVWFRFRPWSGVYIGYCTVATGSFGRSATIYLP